MSLRGPRPALAAVILLCASIIGCSPRTASVKVGILHSLTGTMAISETSLRDAAQMAIAEINAAGGVLGRSIESVIADGGSNWDLFEERARELLTEHRVAVVFGCWTSVSRKAVLPVFESLNGLLFYPVQYEGEEMSPNIFYLGATPNQQLIPGADFMMRAEGGAKKKFYLLGTDYVFPRTANRVLKAHLMAAGISTVDIVEEYTPFGYSEYESTVAKIKEFGKGGDAAVLSTINGDSNVAFYREFARQGVTPKTIPVMAFSLAEDELRAMASAHLVGHLTAWNYYQSIDTPENRRFVSAFKAFAERNGLPGGSRRVTDDPIEAAYSAVYVWKAAVEKAQSFDVAKVKAAALGLEFDAPGGRKRMHRTNHHTHKPVYVGRVRADGQFDVIWRSQELVEPQAFSPYLRVADPARAAARRPAR
jgi:urea transport system substrate-binding protein